jgi:sulfatase maturation enzyme AslB (radical SAM superfamily)
MAFGGIPVMVRKVASWVGYAFKTFILRQELPYLFGMVITDRCNLNCFYCESKNSGRYHFSFEDAKETIHAAYGRGHRSLYFTGGEPMIWEDAGHDLADLVRLARDTGFLEVFIFTNGTRPLSILNCNYIVTVDGPKDIHDKIRNYSYNLILQNVRSAVTRNVFASITFSKANVQHVHRYVQEVSETQLFKGISFNLLTHWPKIVQEHGVSLEDRKRLLDDIWQLKNEGYPIVLSRAAYKALRNNDWKRPIPQIELGTKERVFQCCRDVDNPSVCAQCGYANCVEVSQMLALRPSALWQILRMVGTA